MKTIPYGKQNITQQDIDEVVAVLQGDYLTQGPKIREFEQAFAEYIGSKYAVAVSNGTSALHLAALTMDLKKEDKVITTPITFAATANCIRFCEAEVVFCDIDPVSYLIDLKKLKALLSQNPKGTFKGVIPVDFAGFPVDLEALKHLAEEFGLWIIEDACHAPGGYFFDSKGVQQRCGNGKYADMAIFSFHPVKHIACGEGGMITTNDEQLYKKLLLLRTHGITKEINEMQENHGGWYMEMKELGFNYRLTDFQAALGLSQLKRANEGILRRHQIAERYTKAFKKSEIISPHCEERYFNAYHLYVIQTEDRKGLYNYLKGHNIFAQVHYIPVHLMPYYRQLGWKKGDLPVAEAYYEKCLSLPMYPLLKDEEQAYVIDTVLSYTRE